MSRVFKFLSLSNESIQLKSLNHYSKIRSVYLSSLISLVNKSVFKKMIPSNMKYALKKTMYVKKDKPSIGKEEKKILLDVFYEDVMKLSQLIDVDLVNKWGFNK